MQTKVLQKNDYSRIGILIAYIANKQKSIFLTKLLKILYIIDESAVKQRGVSVSNEEYFIYKMGPVVEKAYLAICDKEPKLLEYFDVKEYQQPGMINESVVITPKHKKIDFDVFSEYEETLINDVLEKYGKMTSSELIELLHGEGSLWKTEVDNNSIKFKPSSKTNYKIPFNKLVEDNQLLQFMYETSLENTTF